MIISASYKTDIPAFYGDLVPQASGRRLLSVKNCSALSSSGNSCMNSIRFILSPIPQSLARGLYDVVECASGGATD